MASKSTWASSHSQNRIPTLLFFLLASSSVLDLAAAADTPQCFFPDGTVDSKGVVCDVNQAKASGGASACCSSMDQCYSNGLCLQDWNNATIWYRNSCTDKTFGSVACGKVCSTESGDKNKAVWVQQCDMTKKLGCCARDGNNCCTSGNSSTWFDFHPGTLTAVLNGDGSNRLGARLSAEEAAKNPKSNPSSTASGSATSMTPVAAALAAIQTAQDEANNSRRKETVVGGVLGAFLGVALIASALLAWKFFTARKEISKLQQRVKLYEEARGDGWAGNGSGSVRSAPGSRDGEHAGPGSVWTAVAGQSGRTSPVEVPNSPSQKAAVLAGRPGNGGWRQSGQSNWSVASFIAAGGKTVGPGGVSSSSSLARTPKELPTDRFPKELPGDPGTVGSGISRHSSPMVSIPEATAAREKEREKEEEKNRGHTGIMP